MPSEQTSRDLVAVCLVGETAAMAGQGVSLAGTADEIITQVAALEARRHPRWVFWSAQAEANPLVLKGIHLDRCWDIAEAHRVLVGGRDADSALAWATVCRLETSGLPRASGDDLFDFAAEHESTDQGDPESPVRPDGYLRPEAVTGTWQNSSSRALAWAEAAADTAVRQIAALSQISARAVSTGQSESAASLLCVELAATGLPVDRPVLERLIEDSTGPRPRDEAHARATRAERDAEVLSRAPGRESTDLRNPIQVRELLASVGVVVQDTRAWRLEPFRETHPLVEALLTWRKAERIATTYGWHWLDTHIGPDDRLRGAWTACDGAAGRMTAQNGLPNLPTPLRPAIAAHPGYVFVRSDLGQIEPRVLAAVSGDLEFARATQADDLYAPVGAALKVERPVAKIAVLAAMYGQTSGAAGEALKGLERAYPTAMAYLGRAYDAGVASHAVQTYGGRRIPMWDNPVGAPMESLSSMVAGRGRFARNAVIQGAAAELFKAWAATVRLTTRDLGARIVLCLHDELLIHVPLESAQATASAVDAALTASARRWTGSSTVRFVSDTSIIGRWSDAKG
ncbi:MAG: polymerase [Actinomycetota bacterium]|nr:polymerase [Actinomycetota bacterium]